jgi:DNA-binding response OmpR family regulator
MPAMMDAGVDDLVCKPFKEELFFDKIRTHLDLEYRYEESGGFAETQSGGPVFPAAVSLSGLPAELLAQMKQAILGCDMDGFVLLLPQVEEMDPSAAASLRTLAEKYDYDDLARIVSESQ